MGCVAGEGSVVCVGMQQRPAQAPEFPKTWQIGHILLPNAAQKIHLLCVSCLHQAARGDCGVRELQVQANCSCTGREAQ